MVFILRPANPTNKGTQTNEDGLPRILTYAFSPNSYGLNPSKVRCLIFTNHEPIPHISS